MANGYWTTPVSMLTPRRLDLVIKYRYALHVLGGGDPYSEAIYRWHIQSRTGGVEPGSWKRSVDDYVEGFQTLLHSLRVWGFDKKSPVKVGNDGNLLGGAHRIAGSLALNKRVYVVTAKRRGVIRAWDREELMRNGLKPSDLHKIEAELERLCALKS